MKGLEELLLLLSVHLCSVQGYQTTDDGSDCDSCDDSDDNTTTTDVSYTTVVQHDEHQHDNISIVSFIELLTIGVAVIAGICFLVKLLLMWRRSCIAKRQQQNRPPVPPARPSRPPIFIHGDNEAYTVPMTYGTRTGQVEPMVGFSPQGDFIFTPEGISNEEYGRPPPYSTVVVASDTVVKVPEEKMTNETEEEEAPPPYNAITMNDEVKQ